MHTIYRYEDSNGVGPYNTYGPIISNYLYEVMCKKHGYNNRHIYPNMEEDFPDWHLWLGADGLKDYFSACTSLAGLGSWFLGFNDLLLNNGFKIKVYQVSEIHIGISDKQCFFDKNKIINC
jgi:hypothetical protein